MKKIFKCLSLCLIAFLCSCSNDDEPYRLPLEEFPPIKVYITYADVDGSDLLDSSNPNNELEECLVSFRDVKYALDKSFEVNPNGEKSKVNFQGLRLVQIKDRYALEFGELDGSYYYKDEWLDIVFGDFGHSLSLYSIWTWGDDGMPHFVRKYRMGETIVASDTATPIIEFKKTDYTPKPIG